MKLLISGSRKLYPTRAEIRPHLSDVHWPEDITGFVVGDAKGVDAAFGAFCEFNCLEYERCVAEWGEDDAYNPLAGGLLTAHVLLPVLLGMMR